MSWLFLFCGNIMIIDDTNGYMPPPDWKIILMKACEVHMEIHYMLKVNVPLGCFAPWETLALHDNVFAITYLTSCYAEKLGIPKVANKLLIYCARLNAVVITKTLNTKFLCLKKASY